MFLPSSVEGNVSLWCPTDKAWAWGDASYDHYDDDDADHDDDDKDDDISNDNDEADCDDNFGSNIIIMIMIIMIGGVRSVCDHRGELLLTPEEDEHHTFQPRLFCKGDDDDFDHEYDNEN